MNTSSQNTLRYLAWLVVILAAIFVLSQQVYHRFDLTQDKRYTLSEVSKNIVNKADAPILVDVYLKGNFPPEFKRLQVETEQLLEEFARENSNIKFEFHDPSAEGAEAIQSELAEFGLIPAQVSVWEGGKQSVELVYPWALAHYQGKTIEIPLLKNQMGATSEERVNSSLQNLQYAFSDGFNKLVNEKSKKVAVIKGNGELDDRYIFDFFSTLRDYYYTAAFTLDSVATNPIKTLKELNEFDLIVLAQPTETFTEEQKYVLDQYTMNGGKSLWLVNGTQLHRDPDSGKHFAFGLDLNLNDFFFRYGLRINPNLVSDVYSAPIVLASGGEMDTQYDRYPWFFNPLTNSANNHPIVANIEAVKFEYASAIDTLENDIQKTILLSTSPMSKRVGVPYEINFDAEIPKNLKIINEGPDPNDFFAGEIPLAVLLEGQFTSVYNNRVKPIHLGNGIENLDHGKETKMIVISDGNVIRNHLEGDRPLELGYDKMTQSLYGNKEFLLNAVNYLLDDSGLINIRTKKIAVPFLDSRVAAIERTTWQALNLLAPLALLAIFGIAFNLYRKRKYTR